MTTTISGSTGIVTPAIDLTTPLAETDGGTGTTRAYQLVSGTPVASTSGTAIDFTGIPSWVKRITILLNGVSTNGSSHLLVQIGDSGGIENTGYLSNVTLPYGTANVLTAQSTAGYILLHNAPAASHKASVKLELISDTTWIVSAIDSWDTTYTSITGGAKTLSATLDRIRITTANGTDTFDAGTINIMYEG